MRPANRLAQIRVSRTRRLLWLKDEPSKPRNRLIARFSMFNKAPARENAFREVKDAVSKVSLDPSIRRRSLERIRDGFIRSDKESAKFPYFKISLAKQRFDMRADISRDSLSGDQENERIHPDYFIGTHEFLARYEFLADPLKYINIILRSFKYGSDPFDCIKLALMEALGNALYYGCWERQRAENRVNSKNFEKIISLSWRISPDYAQFIVRDPGSGFDPRKVSLPREMNNGIPPLSGSGRGILLIRSLMDHVLYNTITSEGGKVIGTQLLLGKSNTK
jgi:anti-sigma regulatory factor (Ser/Thr protein kinase)